MMDRPRRKTQSPLIPKEKRLSAQKVLGNIEQHRQRVKVCCSKITRPQQKAHSSSKPKVTASNRLTAQKVLDDIEQHQQRVAKLETATALYTSIISNKNKMILNYNEAPTEKVEWLGCQHLDEEYINKKFKKYKAHLKRIIHGTEENSRHAVYSTCCAEMRPSDSLICSYSFVIFTKEQILQMADLCGKHFNQYSIKNSAKYFFQVLIPELCLLIFIDTHKMTRPSAEKYLSSRPVDDF